MIDVKTAVRKAIEYVQGFQEFLPQSEVRLEETEFVEPGYWHITLSFPDPGFPALKGRNYKQFRIDAESGEVLSMKVRALIPAP